MNNDGNYLKPTVVNRIIDTDLCRGKIQHLGGEWEEQKERKDSTVTTLCAIMLKNCPCILRAGWPGSYTAPFCVFFLFLVSVATKGCRCSQITPGYSLGLQAALEQVCASHLKRAPMRLIFTLSLCN